MVEEFTGFPRAAFSFWKGLEMHNKREWFQAHKDTTNKPESPALRRLREAIADDTSGRELTTIIGSLRRKEFNVHTHARLNSAPSGFDATHPRVELLCMKDIFAGKLFGPADVSSANVMRGVVKAIADLEPFGSWLRSHVQ